MTKREENLKGRVKTGWAPAYQIDQHGRAGKMVSFIDRDLNILSFSYSTLQIVGATDRYLRLEFARSEVFIKGRNLAMISRAIASHRLVYLAEGQKTAQDGEISSPAADEMSFVLGGFEKTIRDYAEDRI